MKLIIVYQVFTIIGRNIQSKGRKYMLSELVFRKSSHRKESNTLLNIEDWMIPHPDYVYDHQTIEEVAKIISTLDAEWIAVVDKYLQPAGIVTAKQLLNNILLKNEHRPISELFSETRFQLVSVEDSLLNIYTSPFNYYLVVNKHRQLVGTMTKGDILSGIAHYMSQLNQAEYTAQVLNVILESAYEGVAVVNEEGIVLEFNEAYSRFTGIAKEDAIGRHVKEVIDNTNLHHTVKTGLPERGVIQYIQGQAMIVHRIPIWKGDRVIGAIGMLIFEGVTEVYRIYERLQKNFIDIQQLPTSSNNKSNTSATHQQRKMITLDQIIGSSKSTSTTKHLAREVAKTDVPVLITGETGTGKELYAQSIHHLSPFSSGPFISVNCSAIPEHLFESEIFGYEDGAFTGARKGGKQGKIELAQNGTLFLDEIGEMPLHMQTKLLRVLQEKKFERVGGIQPYDVHTRIIAATNRDLNEMVEEGTFREDLYYRINVIELHIQPLRQRIEDIPQLLSHYLHDLCQKYDVPTKKVTPKAMSLFIHHQWKGNIRELINTVERLVILVKDKNIDAHHLLAYTSIGEDSQLSYSHDQKTSVVDQQHELSEQKEQELIIYTLNKAKGNKTKAAKMLGIHRTTLYQKLKKYEIS